MKQYVIKSLMVALFISVTIFSNKIDTRAANYIEAGRFYVGEYNESRCPRREDYKTYKFQGGTIRRGCETINRNEDRTFYTRPHGYYSAVVYNGGTRRVGPIKSNGQVSEVSKNYVPGIHDHGVQNYRLR